MSPESPTAIKGISNISAIVTTNLGRKINGIQAAGCLTPAGCDRLWESACENGHRQASRAAFCAYKPSIFHMIRKLKSGEYRLYSRKKNPKTGKRRNLGTFSSMDKAREHERAVQYFKRH